MGDDYALEIAGIGTIKIKIFNGIRTIGEIRHVKGLRTNLLSLGTLVLMMVEKIGINLFMLKGEIL